jgi:hypothetical protein
VPRFSGRSLDEGAIIEGGPEGLEIILLGGAIEAAEARMIVERMKARFAFPEMPTVSWAVPFRSAAGPRGV